MAAYEFDRAWKKRRDELGLPDPSLEDRIRALEKDLDTKEFVTLENGDTGQLIAVPVSKRGNLKYAFHKKAQLMPVVEAFEELVFDKGMGKDTSRDTRRECYALFVTMTFAHSVVPMDDSWKKATGIINRFKANLRKHLGSYASFTVKEGSMSGWSAPHMIMILEKPVIARMIRGRWRADRTRDGEDVYRIVHDAWLQASGSPNVDTLAIVDGRITARDERTGRTFEVSPIRYALKYVMKSSDVDGVLDPEQERLSKITHAQCKFFGLRDIVGKGFLTVLGLNQDAYTSDLRRLYNELKLLKARRDELDRMRAEHGADFGWIFTRQNAELADINRRIAAKMAEIAEVVPPSAWRFTGHARFTPGRYDIMGRWLESIDRENSARFKGQRHSRDLEDERYIDAMLSDPQTGGTVQTMMDSFIGSA